MHSHNYRDASQFKDKRCLVVGIGNSGVDMAVELSYHAKQVFLSSRKSAWVAPRYTITGAPADQVLSR
jgi:dimethylaniline monooxygenase (N-oxide forming)